MKVESSQTRNEQSVFANVVFSNFLRSEGIWDPEKWFNSTIGECSTSGTSGYNSHFTAGEKMYSRGRKPEWDADDGTRRMANKINGLHVQTTII